MGLSPRGRGNVAGAQPADRAGSPNADIVVIFSTRAVEGQAESGVDYTTVSLFLIFQQSDFTSDGAVFTARQEVTLAIVDDTLEEPDETLTLVLVGGPGTSPVVAFRHADDTACPTTGCTVTVTITDNDATTVAIAADQPAFTATLDNVTFTLTRTGDAAAALDVAVALTQDQDLLESATLAQTVSFGAGNATATLTLFPDVFQEHTVTQETTLTATVQAGSGYAPGSPNTASTRIVVTNPAVTASLEETAYTFAEDATDATVAVILRTATGVPSPNVDIYVSLRTQAIPEQAVNGVDYTALSVSVRFRPSDFTSDGAVFTARQEVTLAIVDDLFDEPDETLTLQLQRTAGLSEVVALRQADGTVCPGLGCDVTVTITDNDDPAPSAAGPPPTDDFYLWTTIITVGESSTGTLGYTSGLYGELSTGADFFYPTFAPPPKHHFDPESALTVTSLRRFAFINGDEQLRLKLAGLGDTGNVTLWIGNKRFPVTVDNYDSTGTEYHWPSTGLSTDDPADLEWEEGDQVRVTLVYERARPSAPTYLTVKAPPGEDGTLEVRWEAPDTEGTFPTTHYLVEFLPVGDPRRVERSYVPVSTTSVTRTDLQTGVEYRVLVQALSGDGYGSEATRTITTNGVPASCAPNPGDLWCGVLTVGSRTNAYGYDRETGEDMGDLSDTDVDVGTNSYTISRISVDGVTGTTPGALTFVFHANTRPTAADLDTLVLQVGGRSNSFAFSDATVFGGRSASWFDAGLDWSEEEYVIVRLRQKTASAGAEESGAPLTAAFAGLPEAHDGETAFAFRIAFSEAVSVTPEAMRTRVLTVTGGAVTGAARVDGEPGVWAITVTPDTREALSITLAPTAACEADGAVCTSDGRALSIGAAHLVSGPPDDARESNTEATGTPTISGTPQVGETLTADTSGIADDDGLKNVSFSYQWLADDTAIQGATKSTYTLIEADEGKTVRVRVSFTDDTGNGETLTSTATDAVAAATQPNNPATGAPAINGTAQVGETLTADTSGIADTDGLTSVTYSYQWLAGDSDISGATGSAYTLADADEGKTVTVRVSFTGDGGNDETLTSAATDAVAGNEEPVAREDVAAWSATMTVEWVYRGYGYYSTDAKKAGSLSPASFEVDGTTYTVKMVETQGWWMYIGVDRELPFDFVLELDGARFASNDASFRSYSYGNIYRWEGTGLSWRDGDTVEVRLLRAFEDETAVNSAATGAPIISGTVQVGETLTADTSGIEDADGLDNAAFTYQWLADNAAIAGATGSTYTLADADEGKAIAVQVSFTDDAGNDETLASAATDAVAAAPPENNEATGAPSISGTAQVGETLTVDTSGIADDDGLKNVSFSYQWLADDTAIQGATKSTYTLIEADEGKTVRVRVSFTDDTGNGETLTSTATDAVAAATQPNNPATGAPAINGTAQVGETLTADTSGIADTDGLTSVSYSYQWLAGDSDISGATGSAYTLADADEGKTVTVRVSFTDDGGNDETLTSAATQAVAGNEEPVAREDVAAWSATMTVEWVYQGYGYYSTDTKKAGSLSPASFKVDGTTYTVKMVETQGWWMYIGVDRELPFDFVLELDGARFASGDASFRSYSYGNIYRWEGTGLSWRDGDTVEVRLLRAFEDETAVNSAATGAPVISGTVQVGETLTADTSGIADVDGLDNAAFTYQWLADNAAIAGATGSTYTLADDDEGKAIKVHVSFTDDAGNDETLTSTATETVSFAVQPQVANSPATGAPTISGTARVGQTLTADTTGIADENGLENVTFTYQWLAYDDAIAGATDSTYTLADADEGKAIKVQVSFTDDAGNDETLTSAATDAVAAPEPPASPTGLSATASHDSVTLSWDDPGDDSITGYVILRRNRDIHAEGEFTNLVEDTGAAATTYTDDTVEPETPYTYRIKAINEHGESERSRWFHIDTPAAPTPEPTPESPAEPPASPTGLAADVSHDSVTLTWDDPGDDSITGYVILRRDSAIHEEGTFETVESDTGSAETTYTDDSAQPERKYVYRIKAINKHGLSAISSWVRAYTPAAPMPAAPTGLSASASHDSVTLTWDDPGDDSITGYVILRRNRDIDAEGEFTTLVENTGAAATTYTDDSVASDTPYTYRIKAINEHGESERSRWFHIQTQAAP